MRTLFLLFFLLSRTASFFTHAPKPLRPYAVSYSTDPDSPPTPTENDSVFSLGVRLFKPATAVTVAELCDAEDRLLATPDTAAMSSRVLLAGTIWFTRLVRRNALERLLQADRTSYLETVNFLGARLPRSELPNRQDVKLPESSSAGRDLHYAIKESVDALVSDCEVQNMTYTTSPLDNVLLWVFRKKVQSEISYASPTPGILGLLDEGRTYMLSPNGTPVAQQTMTKNTLAHLMTPALPPFYRLFMGGLVPSIERGDPEWLVDGFQRVVNVLGEAGVVSSDFVEEHLAPGKQPFGETPGLFYAPALTSFVTPTFFGFLVGPSSINRRKDGALGGLVVEKCKFLQESNCKGMCLNICKLPAQDFFRDTLGVPLTVSPNFETQECQWSFGEVPLPPEEDSSWPLGCVAGCPTRAEVRAQKRTLICE